MKNDRTAQIRQILFRDGKVSCNDLVKMFGVTPATIRRDLSELEEEGQIKRTHGGAELLRRRDQEAKEINVVVMRMTWAGTIIPMRTSVNRKPFPLKSKYAKE